MTGTIRITGGSAKGRSLRSPKGREVRPTGARVRQAVFDVLGARVRGSKVLDLFAGAGTLGLEALSRGAAFAAFVDRAPAHAALVRENASRLGFADRTWVGCADARRFLDRKAHPGAPYDLVLVDPPYRAGLLGAVLPALFGTDIIASSGLAVVEHAGGGPPPAGPGWSAGRTYTYGTTAITILYPMRPAPRVPGPPGPS